MKKIFNPPIILCIWIQLMYVGIKPANIQAQNLQKEDGINFTPQTIDPEIEVGNPLKGYHKWGFEPFISNLSTFDSYQRFSWRQLEPAKGQYDFGPIDQFLDALKEGQRFAFRIMPLNTCCTWYKDGADVPDYVVSEGRGFFYPYHSMFNSDSIFVHDWNDTILIGYMENIIHALAEQYNGDPRIGWIDMGFYGNWGEWHTYPIQYPDSAGKYAVPPPNSTYIYAPVMHDTADTTRQKFRDGSLESKFRILHSQMEAFPNTRLIQSTGDLPALFEALGTSSSIPIGIRRDSWGDPNFTDITKWNNYEPTEEEWSLFNNRWKTAPFIVENWGALFAGETRMLDQIEYFHVASIAFGNMGTWNTLTENQKETYLRCGRRAGYRYRISNFTAQLGASDIQLQLEWKNPGISPTYDNWKIQAFAINPETKVIYSPIVESSVNLKALFDESAPSCYTNLSLSLYSGWDTDTIHIRIRITDTNNFLKPLNLDLTSKNADGSYTLLTIIDHTLVGIPETSAFQTVKIFPNPAGNELTIYWPDIALERAEITDISGKLYAVVPQISFNGYFKFDLQHFKPGVYIISFFGGGKFLLNRKLIVY